MNIVQRKLLVTCQNCYVHRICLNTIRLLNFGDLNLMMLLGQQNMVYIQIQDFRLDIEGTPHFARFQKESVITYYILDGNKGLYAITIRKDDLQLLNFQKTLELSGVVITDTTNIDKFPEDKNWLQQHWPEYATEEIISVNIVNRALSNGGNYIHKKLGVLENKAVCGIKNKATSIIDKIGKQKEQFVDPIQTQNSDSWFSKVKKGVGFMYNKSSWLLSGVIDPIVGSTQRLNNKLCSKIDKSNNRFLRKTKQVLAVSEVSIRNTFEGVKGVITGIGGELYNDGKEIIQLRMKKQPAIATPIVPNPTKDQTQQVNTETSDIPINVKGQQMTTQPFKSPTSGKFQEGVIPFPKLEDISLRPYSGVQLQKPSTAPQQVQPEPQFHKENIKLDELSLDESIIEQV